MKNDNICTYFVLSFMLSFLGCYHFCYHLMLSFIVIISPLFSFSWKRDTLVRLKFMLLILWVSSWSNIFYLCKISSLIRFWNKRQVCGDQNYFSTLSSNSLIWISVDSTQNLIKKEEYPMHPPLYSIPPPDRFLDENRVKNLSHAKGRGIDSRNRVWNWEAK